jgi:HrpA-like RNA helicase
MERNGESAEQTEQPADELKDTENVIEQRRNDECVVGDDADADNEGNNLLPVEVCKDELMDLIRKHSVLVCVGETGSGKTTKIPQLILEAGISGDRMIGVTQPRRVAAITVANRVAEERGCELGREVRACAMCVVWVPSIMCAPHRWAIWSDLTIAAAQQLRLSI